MKCSKCGYTSFDYLKSCQKCGADLQAAREALGLALYDVSLPVGSQAMGMAMGSSGALAAAMGGMAAAETPSHGPMETMRMESEPATFREGPAPVAEAEPGIELDLAAVAALEPEPAPLPGATMRIEPAEITEVPAQAVPVTAPEVALEPQEISFDLAEEETPQPPVTQAAPDPQESLKTLETLETLDTREAQEAPEDVIELPEETEGMSDLEKEFQAALAAVGAGEEEAAQSPSAGATMRIGPGEIAMDLPDELAGEAAGEKPDSGEAIGEIDLSEFAALLEEDEKPSGGPSPSATVEIQLDDELAKLLAEEDDEQPKQKGKDPDDEPPSAGLSGGDDDIQLILDDDEEPGGGGGTSRFEVSSEPRERAPLWVRSLAFLVDGAIVNLATAALVFGGIAAFVMGARGLGLAADPLALLRLAVVLPLASSLIFLTATLAYYICFNGLLGQTPGKMLAGIALRATDEEGGGVPGCGRATLRIAASIVSALPLALGFFWAAGRQRLTWHDMMAGTEMVYT